jgi:hypothetical protein
MVESMTDDIPQTTTENQILEAEFSKKEVREAFQMKHNKAPKTNGFPSFIKTFGVSFRRT